MSQHLIRIVPLALAATLALAAPAAAQTTTCKPGRYMPGVETGFPAPDKLRAHDLPRLTGGYAWRCLVADVIVSNVIDAWGEKGHAPASVWARGARWDGGRWKIAYRQATDGEMSWGEFTATKGRQRVTWRGYS